MVNQIQASVGSEGCPRPRALTHLPAARAAPSPIAAESAHCRPPHSWERWKPLYRDAAFPTMHRRKIMQPPPPGPSPHSTLSVNSLETGVLTMKMKFSDSNPPLRPRGMEFLLRSPAARLQFYFPATQRLKLNLRPTLISQVEGKMKYRSEHFAASVL